MMDRNEDKLRSLSLIVEARPVLVPAGADQIPEAQQRPSKRSIGEFHAPVWISVASACGLRKSFHAYRARMDGEMERQQASNLTHVYVQGYGISLWSTLIEESVITERRRKRDIAPHSRTA